MDLFEYEDDRRRVRAQNWGSKITIIAVLLIVSYFAGVYLHLW